MKSEGKRVVRTKIKPLKGTVVKVSIERPEGHQSSNVHGGDRFKKWCKLMGRQAPPDDVVEAMNKSLNAGLAVIKSYLPTRPDLWKSYHTFLAGRGHGRV